MLLFHSNQILDRLRILEFRSSVMPSVFARSLRMTYADYISARWHPYLFTPNQRARINRAYRALPIYLRNTDNPGC